jgi:hypothetical protein
MALCYKDMTFCKSDCANTTCRRFMYKGLAKEAHDFGLPIAQSDFSVGCPGYIKKE